MRASLPAIPSRARRRAPGTRPADRRPGRLAPPAELVADAPPRQDVPRVRRVVAQLATEVLDVGIDGALAALEPVALHLRDQLMSREDAAGPTGERDEEVELAAAQRDRHAIQEYLTRGLVDRA